MTKHRGQPATILSLKRTPLITQAAATLLVLAFLANAVAMISGSTQPAGAALCFAVTSLVLLLIFQP